MISNLGILAILPFVSQQDTAPVSDRRLANLDQHDLQVAMARIATEHPDLVTIKGVGVSRANRRIEALQLEAGKHDTGRPAILLVANVDGPLVWTSSLALDHARSLAARYGSDAAVKALLDTTTIYIVPRADPDAAEARFALPLYEERASGPGVDDDRDGRAGEDPPRDIDGDGRILWMRVPDPDGEWMPDPLEERALVKADRARGQRGRWKLMREGRDADKDELAAEDQELDTVLNRNFPAGWEEHGHDSGRFATDEPGARALCDFVLLHPEIALVVTYGLVDNVIERPRAEGKPGRQSALPSAGIPEADVAVHAEIGRRFEKLGKGTKGDGKDGGTFQAWVQAQRGLWAVDIVPWSLPLDEPAAKKEGDAEAKPDTAPGKADDPKADADPKVDARSDAKPDGKPDAKRGAKGDDKPVPSDDAKRLRWIDVKGETARFVPWTPFQHPELGPVEIGGFAPYALVEPPEAERDEIAQKNLAFLIALGGELARLKLVDVTAKDLSGGGTDPLWEVNATLVNDGFLPYPGALGRRTGSVRPARVVLDLPADAQIVGGDRQILVRELAGSGGRKELRWLVRGAPPSAMKIMIETTHAGASSTVPEVK